MMLHGAWTYGTMKTDGGDFVTGGHLGYMNFPPVDGGKGDPSDTVGNPGQYLLDLVEGHRRAEGDRARSSSPPRCSPTPRSRSGSTTGSVPIVKGADSQARPARRTPTASSSSTTSPARPRVFAQSWDQALSPDRRRDAAGQHRQAVPAVDHPAAVRRQHERGHRHSDRACAARRPRPTSDPRGRGRRAERLRRVDGAAGAGRSSSRFGVDPADRRAGCSASPRGTASAPSTPSGLTSWTAVLTDPGLPHALWVTFQIMALSWLVQTPIEHPARGLPGRPPALPRVPRGALLHPAAAELGGDRDHLQGAARPQLRARRRAGHPASSPRTGSARPNLALGVVVFVVSWQFIPFHSLIYQGAVRQIPRVDVRGRRARRRRAGPAVLQHHPAAAEVHDHHLVDADGRRVADVLRPDLRADRGRPGRRHPDARAGHVQDAASRPT